MGLMIFTWVFLVVVTVAAVLVGRHRRRHPDIDLRDLPRQGSLRLFWIHPSINGNGR
jgi:hypothetical protein